MITKFQTNSYTDIIKKIIVDKETVSCIWFKGTRYSKRSSGYSYFDTGDEAHGHLLNKAIGLIENAEYQLNRLQENLNEIQNLKRVD